MPSKKSQGNFSIEIEYVMYSSFQSPSGLFKFQSLKPSPKSKINIKITLLSLKNSFIAEF